MSCEIIQLSAFSRPTRPESDQQTPAGVTAIGNRVLTPRQRGAKESRSSRRRQPKPPKIPESGSCAATPGGMPPGRWITGGRALTSAASFGLPKETGSLTAPRSHRLRLKTGLGWSTNGARQLRRSCLRQRPILPRSPGSARNSRAAISLTCPSKKNGLNGRSATMSHFSPRTRCVNQTANRRRTKNEAPAPIGQKA